MPAKPWLRNALPGWTKDILNTPYTPSDSRPDDDPQPNLKRPIASLGFSVNKPRHQPLPWFCLCRPPERFCLHRRPLFRPSAFISGSESRLSLVFLAPRIHTVCLRYPVLPFSTPRAVHLRLISQLDFETTCP